LLHIPLSRWLDAKREQHLGDRHPGEPYPAPRRARRCGKACSFLAALPWAARCGFLVHEKNFAIAFVIGKLLRGS